LDRSHTEREEGGGEGWQGGTGRRAAPKDAAPAERQISGGGGGGRARARARAAK